MLKTISRKNPCDFFRYGKVKNEEDDGPYLINLKQPLKPFLQNGVCVSNASARVNKNRFGHAFIKTDIKE
jgi:hypothetical protein